MRSTAHSAPGERAVAGAPRGLFQLLARRYDLVNRLISFGQDVRWRRLAAERCLPLNHGRFLDVATGTGDQLLALARARGQGGLFVGIDISSAMLAMAQRKLAHQPGRGNLCLCRAEALHLPFRARSFCGVTMAFAIRNFPQRLQALAEARRVLAPGGHLVILEATVPERRLWRLLFRLYCRFLMPLWAGIFGGPVAAYRYLGDSIFAFPPPREFCHLLVQAGFVQPQALSLTLGSAHLFVAFTPANGFFP